ncbi:LAME_0H07712g1_1 [Lachancea meyersii CBS 8951]|uniref:LAME_0H07712g1_1 n=1 Tax=Lachancea meyersii CBS 8951 TaxID=1266667 RepID=A0A1G4KF48_9SACH|nr:LAME_0H07712g1_1 [Lachancea meyersii CBS 8951]
MTNSTSESHLSTASRQDRKGSENSAIGQSFVPPVRTLPRQTEQAEAAPHADYQDKLWTQIDVLDDVRRMAREKDAYEGFPPGFESGLRQLREAHISLLHTMNKRRDEQEGGDETLEPGNEGNGEERKLVEEVTRCLRGLRD